MSGPKVVNIQALRRQQRRESGVRLRELNAMIEECLGLQIGNPTATSECRHHTETLLARLNGLREAEKWDDLLAETTVYRDFYQQEAAGLRCRAAESRADALRREHRLWQSATQLADALRNLPPSSERDNSLHQLAAAEDNVEGLAVAAAAAATFLTTTHREIAANENAKRLYKLAATYADPESSGATPTLPLIAKDPDEIRLDRCWALLGEAEADDPTASIEGWKRKARAIANAESNESALMLDSLVLELTDYVRNRRASQALKAAIAAALAESSKISSPEAEGWRGKLQAALEQSIPAEESDALLKSVRAWIIEENGREDACEQRAAVLRALGELGYEVREGMAAAWTMQGRIIVHKPDESLYGIEFSAPATGNAFQTRVVAVGELQRNSQRDLEIEETWCDEFARLRELLSHEGFKTNLVQNHEPGTVAIKTISSGNASASRLGALQKDRKTFGVFNPPHQNS